MADELTSELIKETAELVEKFKADLIQLLLNDRNLKNDSLTINSLKVVINESSRYVSLTGVDYIYYVIHGRGPGRFPPPDPITGEWKIPFPVALEIAKHGNKAKYLHVANAFDKLYNEFFETVKKKAGKISLAYALRLGTLKNVG
jgi:hypothetical protein